MLIVAIDEVFFDKKRLLSALSTFPQQIKIRKKRKEKIVRKLNFGKFILCSNNEDNFIQIDEEEIRFWIIKVKSIKTENTEFLQNLIKEILFPSLSDSKIVLVARNKPECGLLILR